MEDPLQEKKGKRFDMLRFVLILILISSITGIVVRYNLPKNDINIPSGFKVDFPDQDSLQEVENWNIDKELGE